MQMSENKSNKLISAKNMSGRINWFPGHMHKALKQIKTKIGMVDLVVEIRDARVPLSSGNPVLDQSIGGKSKLIVLNKSNLANPSITSAWKQWFAESGQTAIFVNALQTKSLKPIVTQGRSLMADKWEKFIKKGIKPPPLRMIIVGVPNTGKSTIINRMTRRNAAETGDRPGVTKSQEWIVLAKDMELLDTPGVMPPRIESEEQGMWLCAIHAIKDEIVGKEKVALYVLEHLLKQNQENLKNRYQLDSLNQSAEELLLQIGDRLNYKRQGGLTDTFKSASQILLDFRKGKLGQFTFERPTTI